MRRKSERHKNKEQQEPAPAPVLSPQPVRRRGRPRRKKSPSTSPERDDEPDPVPVPVPVKQAQPQPQPDPHPPSPTSSRDVDSRTPTPEECDQMWHVKTTTTQATGDGGEIQKLKICLSRPHPAPATATPAPDTPRKSKQAERATADNKEDQDEPAPRRARRRSRRNSAKEASNSDLSVSEEVESEPPRVEPDPPRETRSARKPSVDPVADGVESEKPPPVEDVPAAVEVVPEITKPSVEESTEQSEIAHKIEKAPHEELPVVKIPEELSSVAAEVEEMKESSEGQISTTVLKSDAKDETPTKSSPSTEAPERESVVETPAIVEATESSEGDRTVSAADGETAEVPTSEVDRDRAATASPPKEARVEDGSRSPRAEEASSTVNDVDFAPADSTVTGVPEEIVAPEKSESVENENASTPDADNDEAVATEDAELAREFDGERKIADDPPAPEPDRVPPRSERIITSRSEKVAPPEPSGQVSRKRRWGSRSAKIAKSPSLNISTHSLKTLIPMVEPVGVEDVLPEANDRIEDGDPPAVDFERSRRESERSNGKREIADEDGHSEGEAPMPASRRKISIVSDESDMKIFKTPSPPRHRSSSVLYITNLVRPYTLPQLKNLLQRTGKIVDNGFWIDKIKSRCYVQYETEDEAIETRHALHGVTWPVSNPKTLNVDFGTREDMDEALAGDDGDKPGHAHDPWQRDAFDSKGNPEYKPAERRITVREWDLGKDENKDNRFEKQSSRSNENAELDRKRRKSRSRSRSPARKFKKKEEEAPAKMLDDLFKKTKSTPCIYWLPLTAETILIKEEQRRKHMAEHERRLEEIKKMADKHRPSGHSSRHSTSNRHR